jgi:hypothetical protein
MNQMMRYTHEQLAEWLQTHTIMGGAPDPSFDQLSATTLASMQRDAVQDNFFVDGAWQRLMRYYAVNDPFTGGLFMQEPFMYDRVNGGAYQPGSDVQVVQKQIMAAMGFPPRAYSEDIPFNLWQTQVINKGPAAQVSIYDAYLENAVQSMSTDLNIDFYFHGQPAASNIGQNRSININGADEALNNGIDQGWLGNIYATYGGQTRNGAVGVTLNAQPYWGGDQSGNPGQCNYTLLLQAYLGCVQPPDTILTNKAAFGYMLSRLQPQQSFVEQTGSAKSENDARVGLTGIKILEAYWHVDKLAPSTKFGALLPSNLSLTTSITPSSFTIAGTPSTASGYPSSGTMKPGEPAFLLRLQDWKMRPSDDPEYNHNFTPEIRTQTNRDLVVRFYKCALNVYTPSSRDNSQIVGFGY